jgi:hypothetical protein
MARYRDFLRLRHLHHDHHDLAMVGLGFALALIFSVALFEILNLQFGWTRMSGVETGGVHPAAVATQELHGAAPQKNGGVLETPGLVVTPEEVGLLSVVPGQDDVYFLRFTLSPESDGFVHGMSFALDGLARPYDLKSLRLFLGDKQLGETAFFEGKGSFRNLMLKLEANKLLKLSVVGDVSGQAQVGDRLILKLADDGIDAIDGDGNPFEILGEEGLKSKAMSVVQGRPGL